MAAKTAVVFLLCLLAVNFTVGQRTTLEQAFSAAYNELMATSETWSVLFAGTGNGILPTGSCSAADWAYPQSTVFSDLNQALGHGVLRCSYVNDLLIRDNRGNILIDTTGPKPRGSIIAFYKALAETISDHYDTDFQVYWDANSVAADDVLNGVLDNDFDAACGRFSYGAAFIRNFEQIPRSYLLSPNNCVTYYQQSTIWTRRFFSAVDSFDEVIDSVNRDGRGYRICTVGAFNGGTTQQCSSVIRQYSEDKDYSCVGLGTNAFPTLLSGNCDAVWGSAPEQGQRKNFFQFTAPLLGTAGSYWRYQDVLDEWEAEYNQETFPANRASFFLAE